MKYYWTKRKIKTSQKSEAHLIYIFMGSGKYAVNHQSRCWNFTEQEVETKNYWYWIHQRTIYHCHDRDKSSTHQTDECVLSPHGIFRSSYRKNVQNDWEVHEKFEKYISINGGDFNTELGPDHGIECISDDKYTLNEINKRDDLMKYWPIIQGYTTLNTMYRKTTQNQTIFISPKDNEKQIDYIFIKRRYLRYNKDAEANDMIHMGSDHRCVMATFTITTSGTSSHYKTSKGKHDTIKQEGKEIKLEKTLKLRSLSSKKIPRDHRKNQKKKTAVTKQEAAQAESKNTEAQTKNENTKQKVKIPKRKERAQKPWWMTAWRRQEKQMEDILDFAQWMKRQVTSC